jgi:hypothetical protein
MDEFSKILTDKWKTIIESTVVNGYSRKVESIDCFRMNKWYTGYPQIEFCYKVSFNFEDGISGGQTHSNPNRNYQFSWAEWHKKLDETFTKIFRDSNEVLPTPDSDEVKFENSKVDYMTNQGYRFIVQFYPVGFLSEFREEKLNELKISE